MPGDNCSRIDVGCHLVKGAEQAGQDALERMARQMAEAAARALSDAMTWWVDSPTPQVEQPAVWALQTYAAPLTWFTLVAGILIAAIRIAISRKGEIVADVFGGVVRYLAVTGCGLTVMTALIQAADGYTAWILETSGPVFVQAVADALQTLGTPLETLMLAGITWLLGIAQWVMGFFRQAALIVLAGLLPLAAASGVTRNGKQTLPRIITTCLVIICYEPAVGWLIAGGQTLMVAGQGYATIITGMVIIGGSLFALPWLLRLLQPMGVTLAEGGSGGSALGAAAAGMLGGRMGGPSGSRGGGSGGDPAVEQANMMTHSGPNGSGGDAPNGAQPKPAPQPAGTGGGGPQPRPGGSTPGVAGGAAAGAGGGGASGVAGGVPGMAAGAVAQGVQQGVQSGRGAVGEMSAPAQQTPPAANEQASHNPPRGADT